MVLRAVAVGFAGILAFGCVRSSTPAAVPTTVVVVDGVRSPGTISSSFEAPDHGGTWSARDEVEVEWHGAWWPAVVMEKRGVRWLVHYEGYTADWDEVVGGERIRERQLEPPTPETTETDEEPDP
jgi:hypothetical protein